MKSTRSSHTAIGSNKRIEVMYELVPVGYLHDDEWAALRANASLKAYAKAHLVWRVAMSASGALAFAPLTLSTLAEESGMHRNTVRDAIALLRRHGLLIVHARGAPYPLEVEVPAAKRFEIRTEVRRRSKRRDSSA